MSGFSFAAMFTPPYAGAAASAGVPQYRSRVTRTTVTPDFLARPPVHGMGWLDMRPPEQSPVRRVLRPVAPPRESLAGKFKIVMVMDESGSMGNVRTDIIEAINALIMEQKAIKDRPAVFTLVKFSDRNKIHMVMQDQPLADTALLALEDYEPLGSTALNDALGATIRAYERERDVLMVVVTDGEENASHEFTKESISRRVEQMKTDMGWDFIYISCNNATREQGYGLGIFNSATSTNVCVEKSAYRGTIGNVSTAIRNCRMKATPVSLQMQSNMFS
jgi:hypothetical protein